MPYDATSLAGRFLAGDPDAVADAVRWTTRVLSGPRFWALARQRADLVQEVLGRVVESLRAGRFDAAKDFRVYVQGVARFTAYGAIERSPREVDVDGDDVPELSDDRGEPLEDRLVAGEMARWVLERASETCRDLLRAYFLEDRSYADIGRDTDTAVGTVKSRVFRCLEAASLAVQGRVGGRSGAD